MAESNELKRNDKFSLVELVMIIMLVGIVFTLVVPLHNDYLNKKKINEAIRNIQIIARVDNDFKNDPANGYYAFDISMLDLENKLEKYSQDYMFEYSLTDTTVVATSNKNFGKEGAVIYYYLPAGPWQIGDDRITKSVIDENWLP